MVRVDEVLHGAQIDVLKIDVEGADTLVLFGCEKLLRAKRVKMIYFEQNQSRMELLGIGSGDAKRFLRELGYECRPLDLEHTEWIAYPADVSK